MILLRVIGSLFLGWLFLSSRLPAIAQPAFFEKTTVFDAAQNGYATMRIPALVVTDKGTLLAFCEARANTSGDWAPIDILTRRSTDGGKSWEAAQVVAARLNEQPTGNPTPIVDQKGNIHLLYQRNYARSYHIISTDDGKTWSQPADITYAFDAFRPEYNWKVLAPGPGHGIQLKNGRLLVPVWLCEPNPAIPGGDHRPSCVATVYSDDYGKTWRRGQLVVNTSAAHKHPSESTVAELSNGRIMINMRTETPGNRRLISYSPDGISGWTKPVYHPELFDPVCMASMARLSADSQPGKKRILFCNPDSRQHPLDNGLFPRTNLSVKLSYDEGASWLVSKTIDSGVAGYSDIATNRDGTIYVLYESGAQSGNQYLNTQVQLARFNLTWLTNGKDQFSTGK